MKNKLIFLSLSLIFFTSVLLGQTPIIVNGQENTSCVSAYRICSAFSQQFDFNNKNAKSENCAVKPLFYDVEITSSGSLNLTVDGGGSLVLYGPYTSASLFSCQSAMGFMGASAMVNLGDSVAYTCNFTQAGYYVLQVIPSTCKASLSVGTADLKRNCIQEVACENCLPSFSPMAGKYVVSAWIQEKNLSQTVLSYTNTSIIVQFTGNSSQFTLVPAGKIIDGWQRIEGVIDIPSDANELKLSFISTAAQGAYFDDVRFFPTDGSMMAYVYDPITLRLKAELDERNYATIYEYDEEGKLVRVKKETEKGIMTIQENREKIKKN
ncbi:MAG: hypothetical protein RL264_2224 [Bacteroidota bacterium]|jgi:hypothetical protein